MRPIRPIPFLGRLAADDDVAESVRTPAQLQLLPSGDLVWLVDHTVQIGACKLLVIVGCRLQEAELVERPLRQIDLHLVHLSLMEHSTKAAVAVELERAALRTGVPRQIASDQGADLNGGVKLFQEQHVGIAHVQDLAHQAANVLKQSFAQGATSPGTFWRNVVRCRRPMPPGRRFQGAMHSKHVVPRSANRRRSCGPRK